MIRGFHRLYYESSWQTWKNTRWLSVNAYKTPFDLWIYQELIVSLRPQLVVETGTAAGERALPRDGLRRDRRRRSPQH